MIGIISAVAKEPLHELVIISSELRDRCRPFLPKLLLLYKLPLINSTTLQCTVILCSDRRSAMLGALKFPTV